jgi:transcriptional regulator with XRE-family HTH domain
MAQLLSTNREVVKYIQSTNRSVKVRRGCGKKRGMTQPSRHLTAEIGRRLRIARERAGIKQKEAAAMVDGLEPSRLCNYEKGLRLVDIDIAKQLAKIYGCSAAYLLTLDDDPDDKWIATLRTLFRRADERGRQSILRIAEAEAAHGDADRHDYPRENGTPQNPLTIHETEDATYVVWEPKNQPTTGKPR